MSHAAEAKPVLDQLTPGLAQEVRRNLTLSLVVVLAVIAGFALLFAVAVDPGMGGAGPAAGAMFFAVSAGFLVSITAMWLVQVYLFDCWPAFLRRRFLQAAWGIEPGELSNAARWRWMRSRGYWLAFLRGAIVGWAFASVGVLVAWAARGESPGFAGPAILVILSGQLAANAWVVRQVVGARQATAAVKPPGGQGG
jgi:hypothetical protein